MKFIKENFDINIDYMANTFRPKYSNQPKTFSYNHNVIQIKKVLNSHFDLYVEENKTRRSKVVRLTENLLREIKNTLPSKFELPRVIILDFDIFNVNAIGAYDRFSNTMYINSKYNTKEKILIYLRKNKGFFANTSVYAPIKHELGHKFYYDTIENYSKLKNLSYNDAEQVIKDKIADYVHNQNFYGNFLKKNLSKYAQDGYTQGKYSEIVAEAFSAIDVNTTARDIIELIGGK